MNPERDKPGSFTKDAESNLKETKYDLHEKIMELKQKLEECETVLQKQQRIIAETKSELKRNEGYLQIAESNTAKEPGMPSTFNDHQNVLYLQLPAKNSKDASATRNNNDSYVHDDVIGFKLQQQPEKSNARTVKEKGVLMPEKNTIRKAKNEHAAIESLKVVEGRHHETRSVTRAIKNLANSLSDVKETTAKDNFMNDLNAGNGNTGDTNAILKAPSKVQATPPNKQKKEQPHDVRKRPASSHTKPARSAKRIKFNRLDEAYYFSHEGTHPSIFQGCTENEESMHESTSSDTAPDFIDLHDHTVSNEKDNDEADEDNSETSPGDDLEYDHDDVTAGLSEEEDPDWGKSMDPSFAERKPSAKYRPKRKKPSRSARNHFNFAEKGGKVAKASKTSKTDQSDNTHYLNAELLSDESDQKKDNCKPNSSNSNIDIIFDDRPLRRIKYDPTTFAVHHPLDNVKFDEEGALWVHGYRFVGRNSASYYACRSCISMANRGLCLDRRYKGKGYRLMTIHVIREGQKIVIKGQSQYGHDCMYPDGSPRFPEFTNSDAITRNVLIGLKLNESGKIYTGGRRFVKARKGKTTKGHHIPYTCKECWVKANHRVKRNCAAMYYSLKDKLIYGKSSFQHICDGTIQKFETKAKSDLNEVFSETIQEHAHFRSCRFDTKHFENLPLIKNFQDMGDGSYAIGKHRFKNVNITTFQKIPKYKSCLSCLQCLVVQKITNGDSNMIAHLMHYPQTDEIRGDPEADHLCSNYCFEYYKEQYEQHDNALFIEANDTFLSKDDYLHALGNPEGIYLELNEFLNDDVLHKYSSGPSELHDVYAVFKRRHGKIKEIMSSILYIGESRDIRKRLCYHGNQTLKDVMDEQEVWILPLLVTSNNSTRLCKDMEAMLLTFTGLGEMPVKALQLKNARYEVILDNDFADRTYNRGHMFDEEHIRMRNMLVQLLHAAIRVQSNFISSKAVSKSS